MHEEFFKKINYTFNDLSILKEALTHPSISQLNKLEKNYERLEFLGDSVLSFVITDLLIKEFSNENEGDLARRRAYLVSGEVLNQIAATLGLAEEIRLSEAEEKVGSRSSMQVLENVLESLIGAIYIDGGLQVCAEFIKNNWQQTIRSSLVPPVDAKTSLQEWSQAKNLGTPLYTLTEQIGSAHSPIFTIEVSVRTLPPFKGSAPSKKLAEKRAAQLMIDYINENAKS